MHTTVKALDSAALCATSSGESRSLKKLLSSGSHQQLPQSVRDVDGAEQRPAVKRDDDDDGTSADEAVIEDVRSKSLDLEGFGRLLHLLRSPINLTSSPCTIFVCLCEIDEFIAVRDKSPQCSNDSFLVHFRASSRARGRRSRGPQLAS
jgi:hypothetical protein